MIEANTTARRRGRALPARWRITAWIMLTTLCLLVVVLFTVRGLLMRDVGIRANSDVAQEASEFRTFVNEGVDPTTGQPFESVDRMLEVYLARQAPGDDELLLGISGHRTVEVAGINASPDALSEGLVSDVLSAPSSAGVLNTDAGEVRWGRVIIESPEQASGTLLIASFSENRRQQVDRAVRTIAGVSFVGLLLTTGIAYLVAGQILAPVRAVRRVAADISETDLTARVPVHGKDDVSALAETFNDMLDRLEHAYKTQRQFVDDAGHELRTPITVIRGHLELLSDEPAERARTLRLVDDELGRMGRIVSDLLMLAKAEQPDFVVLQPVNVAELLLDIESKMQSLGERRWLLMEVAEGSCLLDRERITQAMLQLATNAVQHTAENSRIQIGSAFTGAGAQRRFRVWISDEGPGVSPEDAPLIFERFQRGAPSDRIAATARSGAGLGLAIVRAIADAHYGSAWVSSEPGNGATFGLDLPAPESEEHA